MRSSTTTTSQDSAFSAEASLTSASKLVMTTSGFSTCTCSSAALSVIWDVLSTHCMTVATLQAQVILSHLLLSRMHACAEGAMYG